MPSSINTGSAVSRGRGPKPLRFEIPSSIDATAEVRKEIQNELARQGFTGHSLFAVKLALEEALVNAIKHGNAMDCTKKVKIAAWITPQMAKLSIEDEGSGFKRRSIPDPRLDENLTKCSGRGIFLIETYMDKVSWSCGGRRVVMVKKNQEDVFPRKSG